MQLEPNCPAWKMENVNVVHKHKNLSQRHTTPHHAPRALPPIFSTLPRPVPILAGFSSSAMIKFICKNKAHHC